jgi:hypothetical protein
MKRKAEFNYKLGYNQALKEVEKMIELNLNPRLFHNIYEDEADKVGWETNRKCRVEFDELPEKNQETMINTINKIKKYFYKQLQELKSKEKKK